VTKPTRLVQGVVLDAVTGARVPGAELRLYGGREAVRSDERGEFHLGDVEEGPHCVLCEAPGYERYVSEASPTATGRATHVVCRPKPLRPPRQTEPVVLLPLRLELLALRAGKRRSRVSWSEPSAVDTRLAREDFTPAERQYWLRWYPDDCQLLTYVSPPNAAEQDAWARFEAERDRVLAAAANGPTPDPENRKNPALGAAWQELVRAVGPVRARYLSRWERDPSWAFDAAFPFFTSAACRDALDRETLPTLLRAELDEHLGAPLPRRAEVVVRKRGHAWELRTEKATYSIVYDEKHTRLRVDGPPRAEDAFRRLVRVGAPVPTLPDRVHLFTVTSGSAIPLVSGIRVDRNVRIGPDDLAACRWQYDFEEAVRVGMGIQVADPALVARIDQADWLLVVGASEHEASRGALANVLARRNAEGALALLPQDSATNNVQYRSTEHSEHEATDTSYLDATVTELAPPAPGEPTPDAVALARALGVPLGTFSQVRGADLAEGAEAIVMRLLVGAPLLKESPLFSLLGADRAAAYSHFVGNVHAAGPLPVLRVGSNPYGVLPVISSRDASSGDARDFPGRLQRVLGLLKRAFLLDPALESSQLMSVAERERYEVLVRILGQPAVSNRVTARELGRSGDPRVNDPLHLWCRLVADREGSVAYLRDFAEGRAFGEIDPEWPLLQRLLYVWQTAAKAPAPDRQVAAAHATHAVLDADALSGATLRRAAGLAARLAVPRLEVLLMEALDLLSHRLDAWLTSLASLRLSELRSEKHGTALGVYGWIERPGDAEEAQTETAFIQAPSLRQALTAAVLKNASEHGSRENAETFAVNLSSERARVATRYYDAIRAGHSAPEVLGAALQDALEAAVLAGDTSVTPADALTLAERYPLELEEARDADGELTAPLSGIDGVAFLEQNDELRYAPFRALLASTLDAAGDLAIFEATDQLCQGNASRAAAWLDGQDGSSPPPEIASIVSRRSGPLHATHVTLLATFDTAALTAPDESSARLVASPELGALAESLLEGHATSQIVVHVQPRDGAVPRQLLVTPADLGCTALDLVVGGPAELELRVRHHVLRQWATSDPSNLASPYAVLGAIPTFESAEGLLGAVKVRLDVAGEDDTLLGPYLERARALRELLRRQKEDRGSEDGAGWNAPLLAGSTESADPAELVARLLERSRRLATDAVRAVRELVAPSLVVRAALEFRQCLLDASDRIGRFERTLPELSPVERVARADELALLLDGVVPPDASAIVGSSVLSDVEAALTKARNSLPAVVAGTADAGVPRRALVPAMNRLDSCLEALGAAFVDGIRDGLERAQRFGVLEAGAPLPSAPRVDETRALVRHVDLLLDRLAARLVPARQVGVQAATDAGLLVRTVRGETIEPKPDLDALLASITDEDAWEWPEHDATSTLVGLWSKVSALESAVSGSTALADVVGPAELDQANALVSRFGSFRATSFRAFFRGVLRRRAADVIGWLQGLTDGAALAVLPTERRAPVDGQRPAWSLPREPASLVRLPGGVPATLPVTSLAPCIPLRPMLAATLDLVSNASNLTLSETLSTAPIEPSAEDGGSSDWAFLAVESTESSALVALSVDAWQEGHPAPEETTGIAFRHPSAHSEAPNALLIAVPPNVSDAPWTPQILANTLLETIELAELRMCSARAVVESGLGSFLPAAAVAEPAGSELYPTRNMLLLELLTGERFTYVLREELSASELASTDFPAVRTVTRSGT
jgi:hypothetical protein